MANDKENLLSATNLKKYGVIYIDPPWSYKNKKTGGSMTSGSEDKYDTLSIEDLRDLPIKNLSYKNSVIFLWGTTPLLPEAIYLMKEWGFTYKTTIYWRKIMSLGMGFWFRGQVEYILFGTRGKVKAFRQQKANIYQSKVEKHSHKPDYFRTLIDEATSQMENKNKIEIFATAQYPGWDCFGNEIDGRDIREALSNYNVK